MPIICIFPKENLINNRRIGAQRIYPPIFVEDLSAIFVEDLGASGAFNRGNLRTPLSFEPSALSLISLS